MQKTDVHRVLVCRPAVQLRVLTQLPRRILPVVPLPGEAQGQLHPAQT